MTSRPQLVQPRANRSARHIERVDGYPASWSARGPNPGRLGLVVAAGVAALAALSWCVAISSLLGDQL